MGPITIGHPGFAMHAFSYAISRNVPPSTDV
jgi:hypothetical protein